MTDIMPVHIIGLHNLIWANKMRTKRNYLGDMTINTW